MKRNFLINFVLVASIFTGCVNVDEQTSTKPSVFWKAPKDASSEMVLVKQIKTDKILSAQEANDSKNNKPSEARFVRATEKFYAGEKLEVADLIDIALENNPTTRIYWFQAKSYAAAVGKANSAYYPQVSFSADVYRSRIKPSLAYGGAFSQIGKYYETGFGPSAQINWLLCDFGKRSANVDATRQALYAANFEFNRSIQEVVLQVNLAFYSFFEAKGSVDAAKLSLEDAKTTYESAQERFKSGIGNKPDMLNAYANLSNAQFALQKSEATVETARAQLALALGVEVSAKLNIVDDFSVPQSKQAQQKIDDLIAEAMRCRQDLLASYAKLKKSQLDVKIAKRSFLPQISAGASASYTDYSRSSRDEQENLQVGLSLSWSVFEGFSRKYDLISARMQERASAQTLKQNQIQIMSDVWSAYYLYQSASKQVQSAIAAEVANNEAYKATKLGYENGVNSITDLLNAQNRLASARQQVVMAKSSLSSSIARLAYAVGAIMTD